MFSYKKAMMEELFRRWQRRCFAGQKTIRKQKAKCRKII